MALDDGFHDGEAESAASGNTGALTDPRRFHLVEPVENMRLVFGRNPRAGIRDPQRNAAFHASCPEHDGRSARRVTQRVRGQVLQRLLESFAIAANDVGSCRDTNVERHTGVRRRPPMACHDAFEDLLDGDVLHVERAPAALEARWGRKDAVWFEERFDGTVAVLATRGARASVTLHGAQVLSYVPEGQDEVLWLSSAARIVPGKAIRGGIPVCWPWFGPHPSDASKPAHGFVRTQAWRVTGSASHEGRARLVLAFETQVLDGNLSPFRSFAELEITLDDKLTVSRARKIQRFLSQPFHVAEAFTGKAGVYVNVKDTIKGFQEIVDGKHDDIPEQAFYMKGSIEEVLETAEQMKKA